MQEFLSLPVELRRAIRERALDWLTGDGGGHGGNLSGDVEADEDDGIERTRAMLWQYMHDRSTDYAERVIGAMADRGDYTQHIDGAVRLWRYLAGRLTGDAPAVAMQYLGRIYDDAAHAPA